MHVLIAPNAFKHSLSAVDAADAIAAGLRESNFSGTWAACPVGDGGDGTADLLLRQLGGREVPVVVHDPLGRRIESHYALLEGERTALIELADASGLRLLRADELDPLRASSFGTGELIGRCLDRGIRDIILCVGGSATVDGGTGLLRALGFEFRDAAGNALTTLPGSLIDLDTIDFSNVDRRIAECVVTVLCDVSNPLVGERGAATVFGPQKGATPASVRSLEAALQRFAEVVFAQTAMDIAAVPRGGAAGGVAAGVFGLLNARLVDGIDYFLELIDFERALEKAQVVITGEGSIDEQTADGKGPWGVALRARQRGAFVIGLAGQVPLVPSPVLRAGFDVLLSIGNRAMTVAEAMACAAANVQRTAFELGNLLALRQGA